MSLRQVHATFADPPREFGLIPLWFWNDDLQDAVLLEQLHAFYEAGFGGVAPHPRLGLSRRVGYLTDEYFRLLRLVVAEAARLGMKVILYDEGSYPSGAANGAVVAENPEYASQCPLLMGARDRGAVLRVLAAEHGACPARPPRLHCAGPGARRREY